MACKMTDLIILFMLLHPSYLALVFHLKNYHTTIEYNSLMQRLWDSPAAANYEWLWLYYFYCSTQGQSHCWSLFMLDFYDTTWLNCELALNLFMPRWSQEWHGSVISRNNCIFVLVLCIIIFCSKPRVCVCCGFCSLV